ncbi:DUF3576 domain-containing protein [Phaeobacter gallaeciensis]|uniref:DUF3576 domain-containing protein n=1 Tax=Phaeobacter gallaeciensis TaxID=60890 RepID=A0AAC9ZCC4_9RHOB|nr:DUF3576 domain-containing protein [Phaeobacter gallaeciensis]AHD11116.1 Domain protein of unknown function [Phaeobacter gallaeciensis DSM 26640]ATE94379.1 Domain protein of unknown function [Phaeobacter gallaeciensis]ATE98652.1 Domain protein of unknown function [Phaeobacter gallaeciensis]ATF03043.1 Domain protein of unknown function [Phaeobacter gallaeciensis]ATF07423.1 Domain protein of unknown function [Phaeobacter gallaeciensis]
MRWLTNLGLISLLAVTASCGAFGGKNRGGPSTYNDNVIGGNPRNPENIEGTTIWDAFKPTKAEQIVQVNRYLWTATLDVLDFLPLQTVEPYTGVIVTGYGTPPGGGRAYRATVHIKDPALDARSLNVSLQTRNGPVSASTARAIEDAILSRARQLRIADRKL